MMGAILAVLNDIAPGCDRAAYEAWYQQDHLRDRLAVPGFRHARRYESADGIGQQFFTFYEVDDLGVFASAFYRRRLAEPTPGTLAMMPHFRRMCRSLCSVAADQGDGIGGMAAVIGDAGGTADATALRPLLQDPRITRARLWIGDDSEGENPETGLRPDGDTRFGRLLVLEGNDATVLTAAASTAARLLQMPARPMLYRLLFALSA